MRHLWSFIFLSLVAVVSIAGCQSHQNKVDEPEHRMYPEEGASVICPPEGNASKAK